MPKKQSSPKLNLSTLTEKQVWRLINEAASGKASGSTKDWRAVAFYFRARSVEARGELQKLRSLVSDFRIGRRIFSEASDRISEWLSTDPLK